MTAQPWIDPADLIAELADIADRERGDPMTDATRESIAANLEKRAAEMLRNAGHLSPLSLWEDVMRTATWLDELAAEVRAGEL